MQPRAWAKRLFTYNCGPDKMAALPLKVMNAAMPREPVIPDEERVLLPLHATMVVELLR